MKAIRVNGKKLPVPQADHNTADQYGQFSVDHDLVDGQNRLEIDVAETDPSPWGSSPLTLELQFGGYIVPCQWQGVVGAAPGGNGKPQKK